ncbi:hypothetical protein GBL58_11080 [Streptococcus equi]|uniref:hypothetical protein n=1 Tax=Streptococcus equi TaxID=1336 RepID=UPI001372F506|nr:hypothetical protein [Streptococcus equi]NBL48029.1 hypothetical protein [Streptococcus equi]
MWAISTYKWVRAEQKVKELQQDKHGLQLDKLNLKREVGWLKNKDNDQQGIFVVEVNKGIYLVALESDAYKHWKEHGTLINFGSFRFTKDAFKATTYRDLAVAKQNAKSCGGRVLQHKPNLEVVE